MLALVGLVTGVDVTAPMLAEPFRAVRLAPLFSDLPTRDMLATSFLRSRDPELAAGRPGPARAGSTCRRCPGPGRDDGVLRAS